VSGPKETHETALAARREELAELDRKAGGIASARLVVFLVAIGVLAAVVFVKSMPEGSWLGVLAAVVAFGALVVVHARIHARKDEKQAAVRFHERALARMAGKWRAFLSTGATADGRRPGEEPGVRWAVRRRSRYCLSTAPSTAWNRSTRVVSPYQRVG
jgi:hypothetical protein